MKQGFIIMQIGKPDLDEVCKKVIVPALKSCGLDPKRVDKHNEGRLLKSEIVEFIRSSDIIIGDLTNERPNCYLEIGYAMGLDKFRNLVLTAREDHNPDSPNYSKGGPKVHFDLSGYDILFWDPNDMDGFKEELEKRVKRRLESLVSTDPDSPWDEEWIAKHQASALSGLEKSVCPGFLEIKMAIRDSDLDIPQRGLLRAADAAQVKTFGWPLGVVIDTDEDRPRSMADGIVAEINAPEGKQYDYWAIRKDGAFYLLKNLFEDSESTERIYYAHRVMRITEALLYADRLYTSLGVPQESHVVIGIRHGGLRGRTIGGARYTKFTRHRHISHENQFCTQKEAVLGEIKPDIVDLVRSFTEPLFELFDFFAIDNSTLQKIVNNYVNGKLTVI